ncbi:MAG: hypothetical protein V1661_02295 [bacterium]
MISLNLLSPEKKKEASKQMIFISLQYLVSWALIAICVAGIVLLATKLYMQNVFNKAVLQSVLVTQEYGALNQKVRLINQEIDFLSDIQRKSVSWSPRLAAFTELVPPNITISGMNFNEVTKDAQIQGHAATRDELLLFKQKLEQSSLLKAINLPIENLLEAQNINFTITGKL